MSQQLLLDIEQVRGSIAHSPQQAKRQLLALDEQHHIASLSKEVRIRYGALRVEVAAQLDDTNDLLEQSKVVLGLTNNDKNYLPFEQPVQLMLVNHLIKNDQHRYALRLIQLMLSPFSVNDFIGHRAKLMLLSAKTHEELKHHDIALVHYKSAYQIASQSGDAPLLQQIALVLAAQLLAIKDLDGASRILEQSQEHYLGNQTSRENLVVQIKRSELAYSRGESDNALSILLKAKRLALDAQSGLFQYVIELRMAELYLEANQLSEVELSLIRLQQLSIYARRSDDKERLLLITARYRVAIDDYVGLELLLSKHGELALGNSSESEARKLALSQLKAQGLAAGGDYKTAYSLLRKNQRDFVNHQQRRNADNLQRQRLMFDVELLEQKNKNLARDNNIANNTITERGEELSELGVALIILGVIAIFASLLVGVLYYRRIQLYKKSHQDELTGLYNRHYLTLVFERLIKRFTKGNQPLTALMLDLDRFKYINDTYGHAIGDKILVSVARCCEKTLPPKSIIFRLGGEEILVLLPRWEALEGAKLAETLRMAIEKDRVTSDTGESIGVTVSIGVASLSQRIKSKTSLLQLADQRLYLAKSQGRNQVVSFEESSDSLISALGQEQNI